MKKFFGYLILFITLIFIVPVILTNRTQSVVSNALQVEEKNQVNNEEISVEKTKRQVWNNKVITYVNKKG